MKKVALIVAIFILFNVSPVLAVSEKVNVVGDELEYFYNDDIVVARGNVEVTWLEYELHADEIFLNMREQFIQAKGNVYFSQRDTSFTSQEITYYFEREHAVVLQPRGQTTSEDVEGFVFVRSDYVEVDPDLISISQGMVTTCDREEPHYHLRASSVEIIPGDRFTARHVSFWELSGRLPLFYWPYLSISLKEREQDITPEVGYSSTRGFYIKASYNYFQDDYYGRVLADFYTRTGFAFGVHHHYLDRGGDSGHFFIYGQQDWADLGLADIQGRWSHTQEFDDIGKVSSTVSTDYHHEDRVQYRADLSYSSQWDDFRVTLDTPIRATQSLDGQGEEWPAVDTGISGRITYSSSDYGNLRLDGSYDIRHREGEDLLDRWAGSLRYTGGVTGLDYSLLLERKVPAIGRTGHHFHTIPEFKLTLRPGYWEVPGRDYLRPVSLELLTAYYDEGSTGVEAFKTGAELTYSQTFRPTGWLNISTTQRGSAYTYSTWDDYLTYYNRTRLTLSPIPEIRSTLTYTYRSPFGDTPFKFDEISLQNNLRANLTLRRGSLSATVSSGRDFHRERFLDIVGQLRYNPSRDLNVRVATGYSLENERWRDVVITGDFRYEQFSLRGGYRFNPSPYEPKRADALLSWRILPDISLRMLTVYDFTKNQWDRGELQLSFDLHCRQLVFSYDHGREEFWVQYQILAFPGQKLKLGTSPDEPMLYEVELGDLFDVN